MARPQSIEDDRLIAALAGVFRDRGYEGASLAALAAAAGLQKPSLYHRFPGGKTAMAAEVLDRALGWMGAHVIAVLEAPGEPAARVAAAAAALDGFYEGGARACLLNMLSAPRAADGPFKAAIREAFAALVSAFARPAVDAGAAPGVAAARAEAAVARLQGALVMARGMGDAGPFRRCLADLPHEILGEAR
jgi:AcrR family transcriptional regulator